VEQIDLAVFGLKIPGLNPIVGRSRVEDFRAYLTQSLINVPALESYIRRQAQLCRGKLTAEDAREMVVLTVGNAYLLCLADAARITAVNCRAGHQQALAGPGHGIARRRRQSAARRSARAVWTTRTSSRRSSPQPNQLAKDKLALARAIGLPLDQAYRLTDTEPLRRRWTTSIPQLRLRRR